MRPQVIWHRWLITGGTVTALTLPRCSYDLLTRPTCLLPLGYSDESIL